MWSKGFWKATAERAVKTVAQSAVAVLGAGATGLFEVDWQNIVSVSLLAGLVSVLTSVGGGAVNGEPSWTVEHIEK